MTSKLDDLDAVRALVDTLSQFDSQEQERIIRWAREKLGLADAPLQPAGPNRPPATPVDSGDASPIPRAPTPTATNIKSFVAAKAPASNNEFAATVAYFYRFEAPEAERKESITAEDLQEACRLAGRSRLTRPAQTLVNAHTSGLVDKAGERGAYGISTVGENLVAMTLPSGANTPSRTSNARRSSKKVAKKKSKKK